MYCGLLLRVLEVCRDPVLRLLPHSQYVGVQHCEILLKPLQYSWYSEYSQVFRMFVLRVLLVLKVLYCSYSCTRSIWACSAVYTPSTRGIKAPSTAMILVLGVRNALDTPSMLRVRSMLKPSVIWWSHEGWSLIPFWSKMSSDATCALSRMQGRVCEAMSRQSCCLSNKKAYRA